MNRTIWLSLIALGFSIDASAWCKEACQRKKGIQEEKEKVKEELHPKIRTEGFYLKAGTGASISREAQITASPAVWDPAAQGYNSGLGTVPIALGGLGYDSPYVSAEITASYRPDYSYNQFQTPTTTTTPGTIGTTTRRFDLDVSSMMFSVYLNGRGCRHLNWKAGNESSIYPFIGGGIGTSQMKLFNFRSTGLAPVTSGFPAFASENQYLITYRFTYQVMGGFEYRYRDLFALSIGYRWFDVSSFRGPRYLRDSQGNAIDVQSNTWKIKFEANEAFIELKVFL